jgi:hypothetical protein
VALEVDASQSCDVAETGRLRIGGGCSLWMLRALTGLVWLVGEV